MSVVVGPAVEATPVVQVGPAYQVLPAQTLGAVTLIPGPPGPDAEPMIAAHVESASPHPAYDDIPDLTLIFENGLI